MSQKLTGAVRRAVIVFAAVSFTAQAGTRDWNQIRLSDTLWLYANGMHAGSMTHFTSVNDSAKSIIVETRVQVASAGLSAGEISTMYLFEQRIFGFDGALKSAHQEIKSASGSNTWSLSGENRNGWSLSVTAGGTKSVRKVPKLSDNLGMTYALYSGMKRRSIKAGDVFHDTLLELTSGQPCQVTVTCRETPSIKNNHEWLFTTVSSITSRNERWNLDTSGVTIYQELFPLVARKTTAPRDTVADRPRPALFETLVIRSARAAKPGECIRVTFDNNMAPDTSVSRFYRKSGKSWAVCNVTMTCLEKPVTAPPDAALRAFTEPTATMQSADARIVRLSDSLLQGRKDRCDSIHSCCDWVNRVLVKRYSPTFSSAVETIEAGFGDCGEHAVLLGALLRAGGIPARVVLGLVYVGEKKGYFYHAWVTASAGGFWVFADPVFGIFPATSDRIPLVIDDSGSAAMGIVRMLGRIKIDYRRNFTGAGDR